MNSKWLKGFSGDEKEKRKKEVLSYRNAFRALTELLEDSYIEESKTADYDCPSWSHKQADINGANRKLRSILALIKLETK